MTATDRVRQTVCPKCRPEWGWTYDIGCPSRHPENTDLRCLREAGHHNMHVADDWHCTIEPTTILKGRTPTRLSIKVGWANARRVTGVHTSAGDAS